MRNDKSTYNVVQNPRTRRRAKAGEPRYEGVKAGLMAEGIRVRRLMVW